MATVAQTLSEGESKARLEKIQKILIGGDLGKLTQDQKEQYYLAVCETLGLNPLTRPFDWLTFQGKVSLYAKRDATDQLRKVHGVSVTVQKERTEDNIIVTAHATMPNGRVDEALGATWLGGKKGEDWANSIMKAETKAKRRVTLSICGLGMLDETEVEDIKPEPAKTSIDRQVGSLKPSATENRGHDGSTLSQAANPFEPQPEPAPEPKPQGGTKFPFGHNKEEDDWTLTVIDVVSVDDQPRKNNTPCKKLTLKSLEGDKPELVFVIDEKLYGEAAECAGKKVKAMIAKESLGGKPRQVVKRFEAIGL